MKPELFETGKEDEKLLLLGELSNVCGAAGDEKQVRDVIKDRLGSAVEKVSENALGNLSAQVQSRGRGTVLITAHMDEVGFLVTGIESNGTLRFSPVGGATPSVLPGSAVVVGRKKRIPGVIAVKSLHLMSEQERSRVPGTDALRIDIGALGRDEVKNVSVGDYVYFTSEFFTTGGEGGPSVKEGGSESGVKAPSGETGNPYSAKSGPDMHCWGKAFDDRAGCAALLSLVAGFGGEKPPVGLHLVFTAQEEAGLRGGSTAAFGLDGRVLFHLNLEGTTCADREISEARSPSTIMGQGPALTVMDRTTVTPRPLLEFALRTAQSRGIPCQLKRTLSGGTDAGPVHLTGTGIPSLTVSVPVRYIHGPWAMLLAQDFQNFIRLARALIDEAHSFTGDVK